MNSGGEKMASLALRLRQPRTLTDRQNDITTMKSQPSLAGLTPTDVASEEPRTIDLIVESGNQVRGVRFAVPSVPGPKWLTPTIRRAGKLLALPHNWDLHGASPIDSMTIQSAIDALSLFMIDNSSLPQLTPTQRSGVQLDWHEAGVDLEILFQPGEPEGYAVFSDQTHSSPDWDGPPRQHLEELSRLFRERLTS
jgi:hypothetical protein